MNNTPYDEWRKTATPAAGGAGVPPDRYMEKLFDRAVSQMNDSVWKFADGQGGCKFLTAKGPASTVAEMPRSIIVTLRPAYGGEARSLGTAFTVGNCRGRKKKYAKYE